MVYLEVNKKTTSKTVDALNRYLKDARAKLFVLIYMEGCGPCNMTRPEWSKLKNVLPEAILKSDTDVIVAIDKDELERFPDIKEANSFPTIRYITDRGDTVENYEDSDIATKDRTVDSFVEWITSKSAGDIRGGKRYTRVTKRRRRGSRKTASRRKPRRGTRGKRRRS